MRLVFIHGWGFDHTIWQNLRPYLSDFPQDIVDLGFYGDPIDANLNDCIIIAHSYGVQYILGRSTSRWHSLISINGFARFTETLDYQPATATRVVERMIRRFGTDAEPVLAEFRERCGAAEPWPAPPVLNRLRDALLDLRFADGRDTLRVTTRPLLALFGGEDPIVTPAMAAHAFADARDITIEWEEAAGHLLPLTHPEWCASMIRRFLAARGFA